MRNYKERPCSLGYTKLESLTLRYPFKAEVLEIGSIGTNSAYVVDSTIPVPVHFELVSSDSDWLLVFDDNSLAAEFTADKIEVYRAGIAGTEILIRLLRSDEKEKRDAEALKAWNKNCDTRFKIYPNDYMYGNKNIREMIRMSEICNVDDFINVPLHLFDFRDQNREQEFDYRARWIAISSIDQNIVSINDIEKYVESETR